MADYVIHYNTVRLHSAIGYITPQDKLAGRETEIFAARDRKLAEARQRRQQQREAGRGSAPGEPASHPAIDFAALRTWSLCQPSCNFSASTLAAATVPTTRPMPVARLDVRHESLLLRQLGTAHLEVIV